MGAQEKLNKCRIFRNIKPILDYMHLELEDMEQEQSDRVNVTSGYEGSGKSYFEMALFDYWYTKVLKIKLTPQICKLFCHTNVEWAKGLQQVKNKPYYRLTHDEGVSLVYSKDAVTKKNKAINKGFKQIRGKMIYHSVLIPQVHRIDKELREDRIRMLFFVFKYEGGRFVAVYPKKRFNSLMAEMHRQIESTAKDIKEVPNVLNCKTDPAFICRIPLYKGELLKYYGKNKERNMDEAIDEIGEAIGINIEKLPDKISKEARNELIVTYRKKGKTFKEIGNMFSLTRQGVTTIYKNATRRDKVNND